MKNNKFQITENEKIFIYTSIWIALFIVLYFLYIVVKNIILFILNTHFSVLISLFIIWFIIFWDEKVKKDIYNKSKTKIKELLNSQK